jgi:hypothetical protein
MLFDQHCRSPGRTVVEAENDNALSHHKLGMKSNVDNPSLETTPTRSSESHLEGDFWISRVETGHAICVERIEKPEPSLKDTVSGRDFLGRAVSVQVPPCP